MLEADAELRAELITFQCKECYVYRPPPAGSIGHRAELWDVDHWLQEVSLKIVTCDEECTIKLFDIKSGALFAECNVPPDAPLSTVVEAVVDSSRYFALKIEDRESKRHAFIGIGFRERTEASNFNAALSEHTQYLRRKKEATERRQAYESTTDDSEAARASPQSELSLKPGETITLKLAKTQLSPSTSTSQALPRLTSGTARLPQFQRRDSGSGQIPLLAPPPTTVSGQTAPQLPEAAGASAQQPAQPKSHSLHDLSADANTNAEQASAGKEDDVLSQPEHKGVGREIREPSTPHPESGNRQQAKQPAADDWGEFVS